MSFWAHGQTEPQLSMFNSAQLAVNPAFAGSTGQINLSAVNRQQWIGFDGAPQTTVAGADGSIKIFDRFHGVGILFVNDEVGAFNTLFMNLNYSYRIELEVGELGFGLKAGLINSKFDGTKLNATTGRNDGYHQESDDAILKSSTSGSAFDVGFGVHYQTPSFYAGASVIHLNSPKPGYDDKLNWKAEPALFISSGYMHHLNNNRYAIEPRVMVKSDFKTLQYELTAALHYDEKMWGALGYRKQEAVIIQIGTVVAGSVKLGYSYDINVSKLSGYHGGTHELMLGYVFNLSLEKRSKAYKSVRFL